MFQGCAIAPKKLFNLSRKVLLEIIRSKDLQLPIIPEFPLPHAKLVITSKSLLQEEERKKEEYERKNPLQPVVGQTVVVAKMKREGQVGLL